MRSSGCRSRSRRWCSPISSPVGSRWCGPSGSPESLHTPFEPWRPSRSHCRIFECGDGPAHGFLGVRARPEPSVTQEEISVLLREGTKAGVFEEGEKAMIERVFRFSDRRARAR